MSCGRHHTVGNLLKLTSFVRPGALEMYPDCCIRSWFLPLLRTIPLYPALFIHSLVVGPLSCFWFLVIETRAAIKLSRVGFGWTYIFISLGWILRSGLLVGVGTCSIVGNWQTVFPGDCTILHPHQQGMSVPIVVFWLAFTSVKSLSRHNALVCHELLLVNWIGHLFFSSLTKQSLDFLYF